MRLLLLSSRMGQPQSHQAHVGLGHPPSAVPLSSAILRASSCCISRIMAACSRGVGRLGGGGGSWRRGRCGGVCGAHCWISLIMTVCSGRAPGSGLPPMHAAAHTHNTRAPSSSSRTDRPTHSTTHLCPPLQFGQLPSDVTPQVPVGFLGCNVDQHLLQASGRVGGGWESGAGWVGVGAYMRW